MAAGPLRRLRSRAETRMTALPPQDAGDRKRVRFFRNFRRFQGGHLKVWHYYEHVLASGTHVPYMTFAPGSRFDDSNPWTRAGLEMVDEADVQIEPDLYFLGGRDWNQLSEHLRADPGVPVINFIQHARHADPSHDLYPLLAHRAIRICVDPAVEEAIVATGKVVGPTFTIQNGIDLTPDDATDGARDLDVLIVAVKNPELGERIGLRLDGDVRVVGTIIARDELLADMRRAQVTLFLPHEVEGAYLPPMEAMALGSVVVCADHTGTSYCVDGHNALRPAYNEDALVEAVTRGLSMPQDERDALTEAGRTTVRELTLASERRQFLDILSRVDELWVA